jgi:hypothetical protein
MGGVNFWRKIRPGESIAGPASTRRDTDAAVEGTREEVGFPERVSAPFPRAD